jgi:hypothetical protein
MKHFSVEDDFGNCNVPPEFRNPIPSLPEAVGSHRTESHESDKPVLPHHFIGQLRSLLCPNGAKSFSEWKWAQVAEDNFKGGSWFVMSPELVDEADPDCVFRTRASKVWERERYSCGDSLCEMWSPARAVAIYLKLQLPLRTYQVRMLDSGEADTHRYVHGKWNRNTGPLVKGTEKNPYSCGIFRQLNDEVLQVSMTGLFISTNKTADKGKDEFGRGYCIPWEHPEVLYWLEKLRNWQEKYNLIPAPVYWTDLELKHIGALQPESVLKAMGSSCFLFRDAASHGDDRFKPITTTGLEVLWSKLLRQLEHECAESKLLDAAGRPLIFTKSHRITCYPLHSLRVSLITAYALEGGVPMPILSKCIAGHARLIMTLYYTKAGITYCTDIMNEATKRLLITEQENFGRWLTDKTYEQLEANGVFYDPAAIRAVMQATQNGASLIRDDKGYCPKGNWGCDSGGIYVNEDSGSVTYGEVPGYPEKNCPRCRWFFTGLAFIDGLHNHWNHIQLQMADVGERIVSLEREIMHLENEEYACQESDYPFAEQGRLQNVRKILQAQYETNNKYAEDSNATVRLIARCQALAKNHPKGHEGIQLISVGDLQQVTVAIRECDKLQQILADVAGSTVYPEHDVSKSALEAGKAFDMMLSNNGKKPVFFRLDKDELLLATQEMTKLLGTQSGSIKDAVPFIEGSRRLAELGLDIDIERLAREMAAGPVVRVPPTQDREIATSTQHQLPSPNKSMRRRGLR